MESTSQQPGLLFRDDNETLSPEHLAPLPVLRGVCLDSVWGLIACCRTCRLEPGQTLLEAGQSNQTLYLILEGALTVHLDNSEEPVARLEAGQTVGEISVIDNSPATARVLAAQPSRLLAVDEETFWRLVAASHQFACNLLVMLAQRMRANNSTLSAGARLRRQLERDATVDSLTGLQNRRWLDDRLPRLLRRYLHSGMHLSLVLADIDHFKRFNDTHGHLAGDRVLRSVSSAIQECIRPTDLAARYGGEELVVILPDTPAQGARVAAERLRLRIASLQVQGESGENLPQVTISSGVAELQPGDDPSLLLSRADAALYEAKASGRNCVRG